MRGDMLGSSFIRLIIKSLMIIPGRTTCCDARVPILLDPPRVPGVLFPAQLRHGLRPGLQPGVWMIDCKDL